MLIKILFTLKPIIYSKKFVSKKKRLNGCNFKKKIEFIFFLIFFLEILFILPFSCVLCYDFPKSSSEVENPIFQQDIINLVPKAGDSWCVPEEIGQFYDGGNVYGAYVSGNYAYVADGDDGLEIIDISNQTNPTEVGQFYDYGSAQDVYVSGNYAYVADFGNGLEIIDISDPTNPTEVGEYCDGGHSNGVYVSGNYAYVADGASGLEIIDINDPTNPSVVGKFDDGGYAYDVYVSGNYAYVADSGGGLEIIDISDPTNPSVVGKFDDGGYAYDVYVSGNYAYVADSGSGLEIIDISDPTNPTEVGQFYDGGYAYDVYVSGNYAYVADGEDGLEIIDISDPTNPTEVGQFDDGGDAWGVYVSDNYAYVADGDDGLEIIRIWEDNDNDNLPDEWEVFYNTNPLIDDSVVDYDLDGLSNLQELHFQTDPLNNDTDNDTLLDGIEVNYYKTSPILSDTDSDLFKDAVEIKWHTNPNNKWSSPIYFYLSALLLLLIIPYFGVGFIITRYRNRRKEENILSQIIEGCNVIFDCNDINFKLKELGSKRKFEEIMKENEILGYFLLNDKYFIKNGGVEKFSIELKGYINQIYIRNLSEQADSKNINIDIDDLIKKLIVYENKS